MGRSHTHSILGGEVTPKFLYEEINQIGSKSFILIVMSLKDKDLLGARLFQLDQSRVGSTIKVLSSACRKYFGEWGCYTLFIQPTL